jgi:hypothetical protein
MKQKIEEIAAPDPAMTTSQSMMARLKEFSRVDISK